MNFTGFANKTLGNTEMFVRRNGPAILTGVGVAGFTATTVLVGRAVLRSQPDVDSLNVQANHIKKKEIDENYTKDDKAKEIGRLYLSGGKAIVKHFVPALAVGSVSIVCVISAHGMMKKREASLLAAYATLDAGFKAYRRRVEEEFGSEKDMDFYRGVRSRKETVEAAEDGTGACIINEYDTDIPSPYARFFDETSQNWTKTPEYNLLFLRSQQEFANNRLKAHGFVFLNEVYESLGLPRSQVGQVVGWQQNGDGDGFVDFGLYAIGDENNRAFINGLEGSVLLDFNVDGPITI